MAPSFRERLREGLRRTRERLSLSASGTGAIDWEAVEESLITADLGVRGSQIILDAVRNRGGDPREGLRQELLAVLDAVQSDVPDDVPKPRVSLFVGVNGVGKTTSLAKLSHRAKERGERAMVVAADTFRAAATEQLATWAERTGALFVRGAEGADPAAVVHDGLQSAGKQGVDQVLVDTAGRLHNKKPLMDELSKVARIASKVVEGAPHETLLVMDATVGSNGLTQAKLFADALPVSGIILTKLDGTAKGGVVFSIARELSLPVRFVGVGEGVDDLLEFSADEFVEALVEN